MINGGAINTAPINGTGSLLGKLSLSLQITVSPPKQVGFISVSLGIINFVTGNLSLPLSINTHHPKERLNLSLKVNTYAKSVLSLSLSIHNYDTSAFSQQSYQWKVKLMLDDVDVSANLAGTLRVEAEESTAKIAEFTLIPFAGPISITKWVGKPVAIYYQVFNSDKSLLSDLLMFRGIVDEPIYDPTTRLTTFTCTDQLQERVEKLSKQQIDNIIQGHWSSVVFEEAQDNWQYAQDVLSTIPKSLDIDRHGVLELTPWQARQEPDFIFNEDNVLYQSIEVQLANRREIHNQTNIAVQYRYSRLKQREILYDYRYPLTFCQQNFINATLPNVGMIQQAISGTGWLLKDNIEYVHQVGSGWVNCGGVTFGFLIREETRKSLVREARFVLSNRFVQTVTENYNLSLNAPQSEEQMGAISVSENIGYEVPIDRDSFIGGDGYQVPIESSVLDANSDYVFDADDRGQINQAIVTKLNQAKTAILKSHRNNLVTFRATINPLIERHHTIKLDTTNVVAQGKVKHIIHECDFNQGACQTTVTMAISRTDNDNQIIENVLTPPNKISYIESSDSIKREYLSTHLGGNANSPQYSETWDGYTGNQQLQPSAAIYPERFAISTPAIETEQAPIDFNTSQQYQINIPNELLLLSA